jgi:hypothetical protein
VVDGELVAFDESGRRSFNALRFSCCANSWLGRLAWPPSFLRRILFLSRFAYPLGRASAPFGAFSQTNALQCQDSFSQTIPFLSEFRKDFVYVRRWTLEYHASLGPHAERLQSASGAPAKRTCQRPRADGAVKGLTAKMKGCRWLEPEFVGQFQFVSGRPTLVCDTPFS